MAVSGCVTDRCGASLSERLAVCCSVLGVLVGFLGAHAGAAESNRAASLVIQVGDRNLQEVIQAAPPHAVIVCNRNRLLTLAAPIVIDKPLTLRGVYAQLPEGLGNSSLIVVQAAGVSITDFELHGNAASVKQEDRAPLLRIHAGAFAVARGLFVDSSKDGVMIEAADKDLVGGVVRDIVGVGVIRDVVSI
jgi:nitrous oxidase accessory protein NosD